MLSEWFHPWGQSLALKGSGCLTTLAKTCVLEYTQGNALSSAKRFQSKKTSQVREIWTTSKLLAAVKPDHHCLPGHSIWVNLIVPCCSGWDIRKKFLPDGLLSLLTGCWMLVSLWAELCNVFCGKDPAGPRVPAPTLISCIMQF